MCALLIIPRPRSTFGLSLIFFASFDSFIINAPLRPFIHLTHSFQKVDWNFSFNSRGTDFTVAVFSIQSPQFTVIVGSDYPGEI